jgi:hypothetical protein
VCKLAQGTDVPSAVVASRTARAVAALCLALGGGLGTACQRAARDDGGGTPAGRAAETAVAVPRPATPEPATPEAESPSVGRPDSKPVPRPVPPVEKRQPTMPAAPARREEARTDTSAMGRLRAEIRATIGEPTCSAATECRALPFGAKPCGGPRAYVIFSRAHTDSTRLARALAQYTALDARRNEAGGMVSDCAVVPPPALACSQNRCVGSAAP